MTKQHKATPEQWTVTEKTSGGYLSACILELRARIEALEAAQQPHQDKVDRLIALDADDGDPTVMPSSPAGSLAERIATDAELCQAYNDAPGHGFDPALRAVYDLGRQHGAAPIRSGPESPLVERVAQLIARFASEGLPGDDARPTARAAILEVAAWFRTERDSPETAAALGQEANR
jgi:hypothetical protein